MKKFVLPTLALMLAAATSMTAQNVTRCASHEYQEHQLASNPQLQSVIDQNEQDYQQFMQAHPDGVENRSVVVIPVIFHVVYENSAQNISTTRLLEQIQVLNQDYRRQNTDINSVPAVWQNLRADCEIEFCLAKQDPSGNWTDGIERIQSDSAPFDYLADDVKFASQGGVAGWDRNRYLNIWVCQLSGGVLGYAQFPGGPASTDGVVIDYRYVGKTGATPPYNKGRTATHEVGHWLNLKHIWGDDGNSCSGSDNVSDTPNQGPENYNCPSFPHTDNCSATSPGVMFMNYMDYVDDACMYFFTTGQKTRIWSAMNGARLPLQTSNACMVTSISEATLANVFTVFPSPSNGEFTLDFGTAVNDIDVTVNNTLGEVVYSRHFDALNEGQMTLDLRSNAPGLYFIEVKNRNERLVRKVVIDK
jgi:hypothetical protein